jgi:NodT family efflux transporter outer membrane factor (OMF) lipoprotein
MNPGTPSASGRAGPGARAGRARLWLIGVGLALPACGCTTFAEFIHNGFKVGPNYERPPAPLADAWIDAANPLVKSALANYADWWAAFGDPVLNDLVRTAYEQNVNLRVAGTRVLEARAQRAIAVGALFPQVQTEDGAFTHVQASQNVANPPPRRFFDTWATNWNVSWEIDFWGRFRRTIESATDAVEASVDDYDNVLVSLVGDVATAYVQYRVFEQQLAYTRENVTIQRNSLKIATDRFQAGQTNELGVVQGTSLLEQLEATIPLLEIGLRQTNNQLCILLGIPPAELAARLGKAPIPTSPPEVVVGIPADLIRRRPDLRSAERLIAAQNAQIGVAEAEFYPAFFINGSIGYEAKDLGKLFESKSFTGQVGPSFQWNVLNYGRILNNVRLQDFKTQELVGVYQQKVLAAAGEVENGIITFLNARREVEHLAASVKAAERAVSLANAQFTAGVIDYTPVFVAQQFLVQQQNLFAQAQGDIALGLITAYRAIGGGWELRLADPAGGACAAPTAGPALAEALPPPPAAPPGPKIPTPAGNAAARRGRDPDPGLKAN